VNLVFSIVCQLKAIKLSFDELATIADIFDANYKPDGTYRGEMITRF